MMALDILSKIYLQAHALFLSVLTVIYHKLCKQILEVKSDIKLMIHTDFSVSLTRSVGHVGIDMRSRNLRVTVVSLNLLQKSAHAALIAQRPYITVRP